MIILTIITQSALCQMQHNIWQDNLYSAKLTALRLIIVCRWRTNCQWKCLLPNLLAEPLPKKDLQKDLADLCLPFPVSCATTWTQLSRLTNVPNLYVDDTANAADNATHLSCFIRAVFQCIRNARLKLTLENCHFGVRQVEFLKRTSSSEGVSPQTHKIQDFLNKIEIPQIEKRFAAISGGS